ncbi:MAG: signal recognition particle-docking protein FtsY [Sandaracinaceae bacterium]
MSTILGIAAAVVVIGLIAWYFLRPKDAELERPEEPERPTAKPATEARPKPKARPAETEAKPAKAKSPAPSKKAEPEPALEEVEQDEAAPPIDDAVASGDLAFAADEPAAPSAKKVDRAEDVKALKKGLASTRGGFIARLARLFGKKKEVDPELLSEMQEVLLTADIGVRTADSILETLKGRMERGELADSAAMWGALREEARAILGDRGELKLAGSPAVILVVGVNGVGKTTTIGKLASRFQDEGKKVMLVAGDTFRAAAVLQLEVWGRRVGCDVVKGKDRADPASVVFDAIKRAQDEGVDVVIADTAGRLHTKANLMEELKKVTRTAEKALGRGIDETLLVLDSTTGQNAIQQAQLFKEAIEVSGIALTKLDGTAKGGVILGIVAEHGLPVHFVGIGERVEDLREFDAATFVEALFEKPDEETEAA